MEDETPIAAIAPNPRCPHCGYSRQGLELLRRCPECGFEPPPDEIVLWGYGHGRRRSFENAHPRTLLSALVVANLPCLPLLFQSLRPPRDYRVLVYCIAVAIALNAWILYGRRRRITELGKPALAIFNRDGCGQRTGAGEVEIVSWKVIKKIAIHRENEMLIVYCAPSAWSWLFATPDVVEIAVVQPTIDEARMQRQMMEWRRAAGRE